MTDTFGDYFTIRRGNTYQGALLGQPGPVLLGLASIARNGGFKADNLKTYGGASDERILLKPGDIYVSLKDVTQSADLLGSVARVPSHVAMGRLTQDTVKIEFKKQDAPADYIYWLLRTPQYREYCRARATGTTNLGLAREDFLAFPVPELSESRRQIVGFLQAIEEKIQSNREINETLESMAREIFKDWFVDFGPTRAKSECHKPYLSADLWSLFPELFDSDGKPEGWSFKELGDVAKQAGSIVDPRTLDPNTCYIGLEHMPRRSIALTEWGEAGNVTSGKLSFQKGDFLFGKLRPYFHKVGIAPLSGISSTDIVVLNACNQNAAAFVLICISQDDFVQFADRASDGTKMPRTSWGRMSRYRVCIPSISVLEAFSEIVDPMLERIVSNIHESHSLSKMQEIILPKLISGAL
ncbi:restriction endonuclease subunit S [Azospirillum sp. B506]|uniref:restriction endonuclease subunit S n=1 Tax=Azospirillum sp. B506 TaxID=137721 RepID=UPI00034DA943|nr:restriction endonuclease subunit S [Azospirillum sp. B506]